MREAARHADFIVSATGCTLRPDVVATRLRCEYLTDPLAVGSPAPRLSWVVEAGARGTRQAAYRILVAGSEADLAAGKADLWDSGRVDSSATNQIPYSGKPLASGQDAFWKVRVWTAEGKESPWSDAASWPSLPSRTR